MSFVVPDPSLCHGRGSLGYNTLQPRSQLGNAMSRMHKSTYLESTTLVNLPNREQPEPRTGLTKEINAEIGKSASTGKARGQIIQKTRG
jgi:hypothetical protein